MSSSPTNPMPEAGIIITSGEPAGIGPDIIAALDPSRFDARLVVAGDREMLAARAASLGSKITYIEYGAGAAPDHLEVIHQPLAVTGPAESSHHEDHGRRENVGHLRAVTATNDRRR